MKLVVEVNLDTAPVKHDVVRMLNGMLESMKDIPEGADLRSVLQSDAYKDEQFIILAEAYDGDDGAMDTSTGRVAITRGVFDTKNYARSSKHDGEIVVR